MLVAHERALLAASEEFEKMEQYVKQSVREAKPIHEVEGGLWESALRLGL